MLISHHCRAHLNTYVTDPEMHAEFILLENNTNYDNVNVILVSTYSTDLLWLQENKEYLYKKHLVLVVLDNNICIKIGKQISCVLYFNDNSYPLSINDDSTYEENLAVFKKAVSKTYNIIQDKSITIQNICIIGGCYRYGLMTCYTKLEEFILSTDNEQNVDFYLVKYEGYNYCILSFILTEEVNFDKINVILEEYNFKIIHGIPKSGYNEFPLHCPSDSCYTIENIHSVGTINASEVAEKIKGELKSLLRI